LRTLIALVTNGQVVKDLLNYGCLIYVLAVFTECANIADSLTEGQSLFPFYLDLLTDNIITKILCSSNTQWYFVGQSNAVSRIACEASSRQIDWAKMDAIPSPLFAQHFRRLTSGQSEHGVSPFFTLKIIYLSFSIQMFDMNTENPELIWNEEMRKGVRHVLRRILAELVQAQQKDSNAKWNQVGFYWEDPNPYP
jgi:hypothetical protein